MMIETREQWEYYKKHLRAMLEPSFTANTIETIEALLDVARLTQKFGRYEVPNLLRVIANDYGRSSTNIVIQERARWLRDLAAKFAKLDLADWITENQEK